MNVRLRKVVGISSRDVHNNTWSKYLQRVELVIVLFLLLVNYIKREGLCRNGFFLRKMIYLNSCLIVKGKKEFEMAAAITLCHHERYDGTGYPNGISGKHIPLSAQITALCDVYDALRSKRPYKEPWPHGETVAEIMRSSGTHFNPDMIKVFEKLHPRFETIFAALND